MRRKAKELAWVAVFLALAFPSARLFAQEASPLTASVASLEASAASLDWQPLVVERLVLTVAGPGDFTLRREFEAGTPPSLSLFDAEGMRLSDGSYFWELRVLPSRKAEAGERQPERYLEQRLVQSGSFSIHDGRFLLPGPPENPTPGSPKPPLGHTMDKDLVEDGNLVVQGNACIGALCEDNDADLPPVLKLKGTSLGILFDDVEDPESPGGASRNWALRPNPSDADQFALTDLDAGTNPLVVAGGAPEGSLFIRSNGHLGLGTSMPLFKVHVYDDVNSRSGIWIQNPNTGLAGGALVFVQSDTAKGQMMAHGSGVTLSRFGQTLGGWTEILQANGNGLIVGTMIETPLILGTNSTARVTLGATGGVTVTGNFTATGTKNFAMVDPTDAHQALYYAALEGPEAGTYFRGTAKTNDGEAVIELPDHFALLTEPERMTVQLTPVGSWGQLYIAEKSPSRLVVRLPPGSDDLEFDYFVQGVRKGYLDYQVKRPNTLPK